MKKMRKQSQGRILPLALFMIATVSITGIAFVGPAGAADPPSRLAEPLKIRGTIRVSALNIHQNILIRKANEDPVTDALVTINGVFLKFDAQERSYKAHTWGNFSAVGTQYKVKIWLNDKTSPLSPLTVSQLAPDFEGTATLRGWLTPAFPVSGSAVNLAKDPSPTFHWSVAGTVGGVCWFLTAPPDGHNFFMDCGSQLSVEIPSGTLHANTNYQLQLTNEYPVIFKANPARRFQASCILYQEEYIGFHTL